MGRVAVFVLSVAAFVLNGCDLNDHYWAYWSNPMGSTIIADTAAGLTAPLAPDPANPGEAVLAFEVSSACP